MAAVAGEAETESELRSGAPGAWAEQAPRSSRRQSEPLAAAPHPMLGTHSLDGPHNEHTWTPTQAWTLGAPSGTSSQECSLHTSPKSPKQEGGLHSTPLTASQEGLLAPTETSVNQEPLYIHHGWPLTQEKSATVKALPVSSTHKSPLCSISPQEGQFNVLLATIDHEVPASQITSPHTCSSTAPGQRHEAETTARQGSHPLQLTTTDEGFLCKPSALQHPLYLHHDTLPETLEGNMTVCHRAQEGPPCKLSKATVNKDHIIDHLGTSMQKGHVSECLLSEVSHPNFSKTSLLETESNNDLPTETPANEGSVVEISQAPLQEEETAHNLPPMALSQGESSDATLRSLVLDRLTAAKGPFNQISVDQSGSSTKVQILDDSSLYVVPSLADSNSTSDPFPLQDAFIREPSLADSLIEHLSLDSRAALTSLDCPIAPSLDNPDPAPVLHTTDVGVVSSLYSPTTLPVCGTGTGSVTPVGDPVALSCLNNLDELPPVECVVTATNDDPCGSTVMIMDSRGPKSSRALNGSEEELVFSMASTVNPSDPLSKTSFSVNSPTKIPSVPVNTADGSSFVSSEASTSSLLEDGNSEGNMTVDGDCKGLCLRESKNPFAVHVDGTCPFPVNVKSAGSMKIPMLPLFPLDSHSDTAPPSDIKSPNYFHDISLSEVHSEVESAIPTNGEQDRYAVNVQVDAFQVNTVTHSSSLPPSKALPLIHNRMSRVPDVLMSNICPMLEVPLGKTLSNVAVIEASPVASVEATAVFALIDTTCGNAADVEREAKTFGDAKLPDPSFVAKVERSSEIVKPEQFTAVCQAKAPLPVVQALSPSPGECFPSQLPIEGSPSQVPFSVGLLQVSSEFPLKNIPSQVSSENDQVPLEVARCQKPSEVAIIPPKLTSTQGSLVPSQSLVSSEAALSRAPQEIAPSPLEISTSVSEITLVQSHSIDLQDQLSTEDALQQTPFPLEATLASPKSGHAQEPLAMEQTQVQLPITFSLEEVLLPMDTPVLSSNALLAQPSLSLHNTLIESPIHNKMSLPTILRGNAKVKSPMGALQLSQDGLMAETSLLNNQQLPQGGVAKHEEPLIKPAFNQVEPLLSRSISLPASPFLEDGPLSGLNPGSEVRVTLDHIIEDALVVSFRLGERIFSGVLMDVSKRFGPHGIPVTVLPKREYKNTPSSVQVKSFDEQLLADCEPKGFSETLPSQVKNSEPSRIQSVWTSNPPPLFHEGAPYPPPLFIRDTYNQSIPQPPPRKIRRPKKKLYREEPTSIMNAIKLRPRQVLCDKCKNSVVTDKKETKKGLSASEDRGKRRHESLTTVSKKLKTNHNVDGKGQTESQKRNIVAKVSNLAHGRSQVVPVPTQSNSPKSQLHTKQVLQSKNIEQAKAREVLKMAKEKAQKKHIDTPCSKNTHPRGQVTRRFQNPSSGTLPPRLRLKPQRYRNEENDSSLGSKMIMKHQPRHITTRSAGEALPEMESPPKNPDEVNQEVQDIEVCAPPGEQEDPQTLDKSDSKSNITVYVTLNQDQPGSSSASVCSSEGTDDLKSSHSECSSTENFDFPPGSMHTPPSSSSSSSLKEEKKPNNELKIKVFSKNVSKCIGADGRTVCSGDIVWAKIYGFPWWPARILNITVSRKDNGLLVRQEARISWFGSPTTSFVAVSQLAPFLDHFQLRFNKKRKGLYRKAITEAAKAAKQLTPEVRALLTQFET